MYEACFDRLKQKTGREHIDDAIWDIKEADKQNHQLQSAVDELDGDIDELEEEISHIKQEIHKLKLTTLMGNRRGAVVADETTAENEEEAGEVITPIEDRST
jgi:chromosome segregation ATPase